MGNIYSVGQVNTYIKNMFTQDFMLNRISIRGEISNCKYHTSGHIYFSLKDTTGAISCVMFAGQRRGLAFAMKNGDKVIVTGSVSVYERDGKYQMYAKEISLEGAGLLYEKFLALKAQLEEMGMFAQEYKRPIPRYIRRLGVVTAPTGAAIQDIRNITQRRNPYVEIILYPALVQGNEATHSIVCGIQALERLGVDVMIVGRGGGSMEDLWAFNEEEVARAIFQCSVPIISAVGHETDITIADYVADLRAPTPSAAAELAVYDFHTLSEQLENSKRRLNMKMNHELLLQKRKLQYYQTKLNYLSPESMIRERRMRLLQMEEKMQTLMEQNIIRRRHQLNIYIEKMKGLSPLNKLNQGFSYVENQQHQAVTSIEQVYLDDSLCIHVKDGKIWTRVEKTEGEIGYGKTGNEYRRSF